MYDTVLLLVSYLEIDPHLSEPEVDGLSEQWHSNGTQAHGVEHGYTSQY